MCVTESGVGGSIPALADVSLSKALNPALLPVSLNALKSINEMDHYYQYIVILKSCVFILEMYIFNI